MATKILLQNNHGCTNNHYFEEKSKHQMASKVIKYNKDGVYLEFTMILSPALFTVDVDMDTRKQG